MYNNGDDSFSSKIGGIVGTTSFLGLLYSSRKRILNYVKKNDSYANSMATLAGPQYNRYVRAYEGFVGKENAGNQDQIINYLRSKGYLRQKVMLITPTNNATKALYDITPDAPLEDISSIMERSGINNDLIDVQSSTFGILGDPRNETPYVGLLDQSQVKDASYLFNDFDEYTEFINQQANANTYGSYSNDTTLGIKGNRSTKSFVEDYIDKRKNIERSNKAMRSFNERFPGVLAIYNSMEIGEDNKFNKARIGQVIEEKDSYVLSLVTFDSKVSGNNPEFVRDYVKLTEAISRGHAEKTYINIPKADRSGNLYFNHQLYMYKPEVDVSHGRVVAPSYYEMATNMLIGRPDEGVRISAIHSRPIEERMISRRLTYGKAVKEYTEGKIYSLVANNRTLVRSHQHQAIDPRQNRVGLESKVAMTGDIAERALYTQGIEGSTFEITDVVDTNSPETKFLNLSGKTENLPGRKKPKTRYAVMQGEGNLSVIGSVEMKSTGLRTTGSASIVGRSADMFMSGGSFEEITPKFASDYVKDSKQNIAISEEFNNSLYKRRLIHGTFGNLTEDQYEDLKTHSIERRAGIIQPYLLVAEEELDKEHAITEGAEAFVRKQTIPGVIDEIASSGFAEKRTIKLAVSSGGKVSKETIRLLTEISTKYHGNLTEAKRELGDDVILGYDLNSRTPVRLGDLPDVEHTNFTVNPNQMNRYGYISLSFNEIKVAQQTKDTLKGTVSKVVDVDEVNTLFNRKLPTYMQNQYSSLAKTVSKVTSFEDSISKMEGRLSLGVVGDILAKTIDDAANSSNMFIFGNDNALSESDITIDEYIENYKNDQLSKIGAKTPEEQRKAISNINEAAKKLRYEYDMVIRQRFLDRANADGSAHQIFADLLGISKNEAKRVVNRFEYGMDNNVVTAILGEGINDPEFEVANYRFETSMKKATSNQDEAYKLMKRFRKVQQAVEQLQGKLVPQEFRTNRDSGMKMLYSVAVDIDALGNNFEQKDLKKATVVYRNKTVKALGFVHNTLGNISKASDAPTSYARGNTPGINGYTGGAKITYEGNRNSVLYDNPALSRYNSWLLAHNTNFIADTISVREAIKQPNPRKYLEKKRRLNGELAAANLRSLELETVPQFVEAITQLGNSDMVLDSFDKLSSEKIIGAVDSFTLDSKTYLADILGIDKDVNMIEFGDIIEPLKAKGNQFAIATEIAEKIQLAIGTNTMPMIKLPKETADEVGLTHLPLLNTTKDQKFKFDSVVNYQNRENVTRSFTTGDASVQANMRIIKDYADHKRLLDESIALKVKDEAKSKQLHEAAIQKMKDAIRLYDKAMSEVLKGKHSIGAKVTGNFRKPFSMYGRISASNTVKFNEVGILRDIYLATVTHGNVTSFDEIQRYTKFRASAQAIADKVAEAHSVLDIVAKATANVEGITTKAIEQVDHLKNVLTDIRHSFGEDSIGGKFFGIDIDKALVNIRSAIDEDTFNAMETTDLSIRAKQVSDFVRKTRYCLGTAIEPAVNKFRIAELAATAIDEAEKGLVFTELQGYPELNETSGRTLMVKLLDYDHPAIYGKSFEKLVSDFENIYKMNRSKAVATAKKLVSEGKPNIVLSTVTGKSISRDYDGDGVAVVLESLDHISKSAAAKGEIFKEILSSVSAVKQEGVIDVHLGMLVDHLSHSMVITRAIDGKEEAGFLPASASTHKAMYAIESSTTAKLSAEREIEDVLKEKVASTLESYGYKKGSKEYRELYNKYMKQATETLTKRSSNWVNGVFAEEGVAKASALKGIKYLETNNSLVSVVPVEKTSLENATSMWPNDEVEDSMHKLKQLVRAGNADANVKVLAEMDKISASRFDLIKGSTPRITSIAEQVTAVLMGNRGSMDHVDAFIRDLATESLVQKAISSKKGTPGIKVDDLKKLFTQIADVRHIFTQADIDNHLGTGQTIFVDNITRSEMEKFGFYKSGKINVEEAAIQYKTYENYMASKVEALQTVKSAYEKELSFVLRKHEAAVRAMDVNKHANELGYLSDNIRNETYDNVKSSFKNSDNVFLKNLDDLLPGGRLLGVDTIDDMLKRSTDILDKTRKFKNGPLLESFLSKLSQYGKYQGMNSTDIFNSLVGEVRSRMTFVIGGNPDKSVETLFRTVAKNVVKDSDDRNPDLSEVVSRVKEKLHQDEKDPKLYHFQSNSYQEIRHLQTIADIEGISIKVHPYTEDQVKRTISRDLASERRSMRDYAKAIESQESSMMRKAGIFDSILGKEMNLNISNIADDIERSNHKTNVVAGMFAIGAGFLGGMFARQVVSGYAIPDLKRIEGRGGQYYDRTQDLSTDMFGAESEIFLKKKPIRVANAFEQDKRQSKLESYIRNKEIAKRISERDGSKSKRIDSRFQGVVI